MQVTIRRWLWATVTASVAALAGSPVECAAQSGFREHGTSLSAAIEQARQSPFRAGAESVRGEPLLNRMAIPSTPVSHLLQTAPKDENFTKPVAAFTFIASAVSHLAGSYLLFYCLDNQSYKSSNAGCIIGPIIPFPAVAAPAAGSKLGPRKAFKASAFGWLGGAAAFSLTTLASDRINNFGAALISGAVHAIVTVAVLRRPTSLDKTPAAKERPALP